MSLCRAFGLDVFELSLQITTTLEVHIAREINIIQFSYRIHMCVDRTKKEKSTILISQCNFVHTPTLAQLVQLRVMAMRHVTTCRLFTLQLAVSIPRKNNKEG